MEAYKRSLIIRSRSQEFRKGSSNIQDLNKLNLNYSDRVEEFKGQKSKQQDSLRLMSQDESLKRQNFFEMIGLKNVRSKKKETQITDFRENNRKISIIDFMGKKKISFLKKSGFLDYYQEYQRGKGFFKMLEQKQLASMPNLVHKDKIREYAIKHPASPKEVNLNSLFFSQKYQNSIKQSRIDSIQTIILKCEVLYKESKKASPGFRKLMKQNQNGFQKKIRIGLQEFNSLEKQWNSKLPYNFNKP